MNSHLKSFIAFSLAVTLFQANAMESTHDVSPVETQSHEQSSERLSPKVKVALGLIGTTVAVYGAYVAYVHRDLIQDRFSKAYDNCTLQEAEALQKTLQDGFVNGVITVKDYAVDFGTAVKDTALDAKNWVVGFFKKPEVQETALLTTMVVVGAGTASTSSNN